MNAQWEAELIRLYELSPVTVRRAVKILVDEGAVTATPGRNVLVTDPVVIGQFKGAVARDGISVGRRLSTAAFSTTALSSVLTEFMRAKTSERSSVSMVMPFRCRASSSMRTVLNAVVRAPTAPMTIFRMP